MTNTNNKETIRLSFLNLGKRWFTLFFVFILSFYGYASTSNIKIDSISQTENNLHQIVSGKIYLTQGTIISGIEKSSSIKIVYIENKSITKKTIKCKKEKAVNKEKTIKKNPQKEKIVYFQSKIKTPSSFFYQSGNTISSILPTSLNSSKKETSSTNKAKQISFSAYQNNEKIKIPSLFLMEECQFQKSSWRVRPPPH